MFQPILVPEISASTTKAVYDLLYLLANPQLHLERLRDLDNQRNALVAEADKLRDLENRAEALEKDRYNLEAACETRQKDLDTREAELCLNQAAFATERDGVRAALQKDREELEAEKREFAAERRRHAEVIRPMLEKAGLLDEG
jgi:hypothetical protein